MAVEPTPAEASAANTPARENALVLVRGGCGEQLAKQLLDVPHAAPITFGGSSTARTCVGQAALGELVAGGEQQPPVRPRGGGLATVAAELLTGDPLAHLGQCLVSELD